METIGSILLFLVIGALFFLMMRRGGCCGAGGHGKGDETEKTGDSACGHEKDGPRTPTNP